MSEKESYIVRGGTMKCKFGSHERKINLPKSHGSYINGKPMMRKTDSMFKKNIPYFGVCSVPINDGSPVITLATDNGAPVTGKRCIPVLLGPWLKTKNDTKVKGIPALTTNSYLLCGKGGKISFCSDGQFDDK
ncbi:DUF4280 domain-containing protein [Dethiothermospora halolimnae]|uniref:DUF4280 domain-containing protein n=1 Tax=Dethiothermospora halolimnae TaxID=3114390 RepID=UPI003CCBBC65